MIFIDFLNEKSDQKLNVLINAHHGILIFLTFLLHTPNIIKLEIYTSSIMLSPYHKANEFFPPSNEFKSLSWDMIRGMQKSMKRLIFELRSDPRNVEIDGRENSGDAFRLLVVARDRAEGGHGLQVHRVAVAFEQRNAVSADASIGT